MNPLRTLFRFNGGVKPATHKHDSTGLPIATDIALPALLKIPLGQSAGQQALPLVTPGQHVLKGERIGAADGILSTAIHAPTSGTITAISTVRAPHPSGLSVPALLLAPDGKDTWAACTPPNILHCAPDELRDMLRDAGIVGLGGAVFPSHAKLKPGTAEKDCTLIINGAECEPFITCDDMLMRERATGIIRGTQLMAQLLRAQQILIGIEDNKPEAITAMEAAVIKAADPRLRIIPVDTRYPTGGAKQLIRVLTGIKVPHGKRSTDYGVQCFNVGTAYAIHQALDLGRPLISRIVTVAGNVSKPRNYEVLIGTPMNEVVALSSPLPDTDRYIMGGPMMGVEMPSQDVPVVKATNAILAGCPALFPPPAPELPCIRCGECARACPAELQPFELYWHSRSKNFGKAQEYHLFDCIECGCCAYVCPSHIPLVDYYRFAKSEIWAREREKDAADAARERFEFRNYRQQREEEEKAARLAAKTAEGRARAAATAAGSTEAAVAEDPKKALIAAALARAKAQQAAIAPQNTTRLDTETQAEISRIEARRAQLQSDSAPAPAPSATAVAGGQNTHAEITPTATSLSSDAAAPATTPPPSSP